MLIALPAKNEATRIRETLLGIASFTSTQNSFNFETVVFDDASTDNTSEIVTQLGQSHYLISKSHGLGHVFSLIIEHFLSRDFDYLVTIDADGQFKAQEIEKLLHPLLTGNAVMSTGSRFMNGSQVNSISAIKKWGNKIGAWVLSSILNETYHDVTCGFRAYTRTAILKLHTFSNFTYTQEVFLNLGIKKLPITEVPVSVVYHKDRKSKMTKSVLAYIYRSLKIILKFLVIYAPMKLFGFIGNISFILGIGCMVFVFIWDHTHGNVTPYKWVGILGVSLMGSSVIFYALGILLQITSRIQLTSEEGLYYIKKKEYGE